MCYVYTNGVNVISHSKFLVYEILFNYIEVEVTTYLLLPPQTLENIKTRTLQCRNTIKNENFPMLRMWKQENHCSSQKLENSFH